MRKAVYLALISIFAAVFVFSSWKLLHELNGYRESRNSYEALEQYAAVEKPEPQKTPAAPPEPESVMESDAPQNTEADVIPEVPEAPDVSQWPQVDFGALAEINSDIIGWIFIEGTDINYPVVQGDDNDYYLNHLFDRTESRSGCIFLDFRCSDDFSDRHSIIYGHHMNDNRMFSGLMAYKEQAFYDEHPVALLVTPTAYHKIQLFSGYVADNKSNSWELLLNDSNTEEWLQALQSRSCFTPEYLPSATDRIVTLSTCTYEFDDAKFLVHGYLSESIPVKPIETDAYSFND